MSLLSVDKGFNMTRKNNDKPTLVLMLTCTTV